MRARALENGCLPVGQIRLEADLATEPPRALSDVNPLTAPRLTAASCPRTNATQETPVTRSQMFTAVRLDLDYPLSLGVYDQ